MYVRRFIVGAATCVALTCASSPRAWAASVSYQVSVNTSSDLAGYGYIDLQLNPGTMTTQPVNANVVGFHTDGVLNPADPNNGTTGAVSGMLPAQVMISNTTSTNEYTEALTFGTTINFNLTLSGPGVNLAGHAGGSSGSTFVLDFFDQNGDALFVNTASTDPYSFAAGLVQISAQGLVTTSTNPGPNNTPPVVTFTPAPEPASFGAAGVALLVLIGLARKRMRTQ